MWCAPMIECGVSFFKETILIMFHFIDMFLFVEISHLFFSKENDWGFSHFVAWNVSSQ